MKVKPPRDWTVDILGKRFAVVWKAPGKDMGECDAKACQIKVDPTIGLDQQRDTLLHEIVHAIDHEMDTNMRERQVRLTATGLFHFMRANPEIVRWLCETDAS